MGEHSSVGAVGESTLVRLAGIGWRGRGGTLAQSVETILALTALKKRAGSRLVRAWELKEDLRAVFRAADGSEAAELLDDWMHR
ncbi:transposase, partial [Adlercreutzia equolifaciens]|nr:transposase [Adlercreutzia equolifaciens]